MTVLAAAAHLSLFIIAGQSNAQGYGFPIPAEQPIAHVYNLTSGQLAPAIDPLVPGGGVGFSRAFGAYLAKRGMVVGIVNCGIGGTWLDSWQPTGSSFQACIPLVRAAMRYGTVRGLLWDQGEADASRSMDEASTWAARFPPVVAAFRSLVGNPRLPVVFAQTAPIPDWILPYIDTVREQQAATYIPGVTMVGTAGVELDVARIYTHFTPAGYNTLGTMLAQAWLREKYPRGTNGGDA